MVDVACSLIIGSEMTQGQNQTEQQEKSKLLARREKKNVIFN